MPQLKFCLELIIRCCFTVVVPDTHYLVLHLMQHDANGWDDASHDARNAWYTTW